MGPSTQRTRRQLYGSYVSTHTGAPPVEVARHALSRQVLPLLPPDRDARILDAGCGAGDLLRMLRGRGYANVVGVDLSAEQVALAEQRGVPGIERVDVRDHLRTRPRQYDAIVALDLLEHFGRDELIELLEVIASGLKPGGHLVARTPNAESPFFGRLRYGDFTHGLAFTARSLEQVLRSTGFEDVRFLPVNPIAHGPVSALRAFAWQLIAAALKLCLTIETGAVRGHMVTQNLMVTARRGQ